MNRICFFIFSSCFLLITLSYSQWTSFDLDPAVGPDFKKQVEPLIYRTSLAMGHHPVVIRNPELRLRTGISYSRPVISADSPYTLNRSGGFTEIYGTVVVTSNFYLHGKLAAFASGSDVVQSVAWGFDLFLSDNAGKDWRLATQFSRLLGPEDLRQNSLDLFLLKEIVINRIPVTLGVGLNHYKADILLDTEAAIPSKIEGEINYFRIGTWKSIKSFIVASQIQIHPQIIRISVDLVRGFR